MNVRQLIWTGLLALVAMAAHAQVEPYEEYGKHLRAAQEVTPLTSQLFGDQVSLYNGATEFDVTDIDLPGNSGLPVRLARRFAVNDRRQTVGNLGGFGEWDIEVPYIDGVFAAENGWQVQGTNNSGTYARCSVVTPPYTIIASLSNVEEPAYQIWDGNQLHIPGEVSEELLHNTETKLPDDRTTYPWITKSLYHASCAPTTANGYPGESFVVVSPGGVRYTFNWMVVNPDSSLQWQQPNPSGLGTVKAVANRSRIFLLATRIDDRFGNWVTYTYNSASQLTKIAANDGREIDLTWSGSSVQSATAGTRTWTYGYAADGTLSSVTRPDGSQWRYAVASGSLHTTKNTSGEAPPTYHCQIDPDPNTGSFVYTISAPSGAQGTFSFTYQRNYRSYVPESCTDTNVYTEYPDVYDFFDNFALVSKQISGAGLTTQNWGYNYGSNNGGYVLANTPYPGALETYIPQSNSAYFPPKVVSVTDPSGVTKYSFGVNYGVDEGRLLQTERDSSTGTVVRAVTNSYLAESQVAGEAFPGNAGLSVQPDWKNPMVGRLRPQISTVTAQDGDTYTRQTEAFDVFAQPTKVKRFNSIAGQSAIEEQTSYYNDLPHWVLGLPLEVDNLTTGETESLNTYDTSNATLKSSTRFGEPLLSYTYNAAGQLASFTDGDNHTTSLSNYYRGIPQLINYPDNTSQSATVDDYGEITAVTDQAGHTTQYSYTSSGWPSQIIYPANDEVAWLPKVFAFQYVTTVERGIPAGHWRRTVSTGNNSEVTYFDALLRPLLDDSSIIGTAGSDITTAKGYDWRGLTTFASTPVSGAPDLSGITGGVHETYDALGRLTQSQQDSELGTLTTSTAYLSGSGMQVTDPKGNVTTTRYQVFDQPGYNAVTSVQAPAGVTQTIARDLYGNPTAITQSGLYNGIETDSVTKTLTYDSYHRLCRTTEPESGSAVMAYDGANNLAWSASGVSVTGTGCGQDQVTAPAQTTFTHDPMNRVLTIAPPSGTQSTQYTYDALGQMIRATSGITDWNATYNFRGMVTGESLSVVGQTPLALGYAHDAYGSLSLIHYPDGENVSYAPDARGRPTQVGSYASQVSTFPNGEIASFKYGNGAGYVASQNTRQLLSNFSYGTASTVNLSEDFVYDADGNITNVNDLAGGPRNKTFGYDGLNRLTNAQASGLWGTEVYTYDPLNNLRTRLSAGQTFTYNYDATNKLTSLTNGASTVGSYQYDNRGNTIGKNGVALLFDQKNQLSQIAGYDSYAYDAFGRRVTKTPASGGAATYYFYNHAGQLMYQYAPGSAQTTNFIYLGTRLIARNVNLRLAAPGGIGFGANPNNGSYTVSWGAVPAATSYTVQESANGGGWATVATVSSTSAALSSRVGGSYVYRVQGCSGATCGGWTTSATLGVTPTLPTVSVPSGATTGSYTVSWTAPAGATAYTVQERFNGGAWNTIASNTTATSISRPGTTGGSYTYQVSASNAYGTRGWAASGAVEVTTIVGNIDGLVTTDAAGDVSIAGWACSTGIAQSISVDLYVGGPAGSGVFISRTSANQTSEPGVASACQVSTGSYRFSIPLAMTTRSQYAGKAIYIHGISPAGGPNLLISGSGNFSVPAVPTAPAAPASLSAGLSADLSTITLSWPAANTATSYVVQQQFNGGTWTQVANGSATAATVSQPADGSYLYRVQACSGVGCSGWTSSNTVTVLHAPTAAPGVTVPASSSNGSYTVSWSGVAGPVSYTLQEQVNGGGWTTVQANAMTSWSTAGRGDGTYGYRAQACNTTGCGPWSATASTTVLLPPPTPASMSAPGSSSGIFTVTWAASATATGYTLQQSLNGGGWTTVYNNAANGTTLNESASGSYALRVQACNSSGCSAYATSNPVAVTVPPASAPALSVPASSNNGSYAISWGGVSGATSYTLQEQVNGGGWTTVQANGAGSWSTSGRGNGTYSYRVQACNVGGCGPWSGTGAVVVTLQIPIAINGNAYDEAYAIQARQQGYSTIGFAITGGSAWEVYGASPAGNVVKASGAMPSGAVTVQYTWTLVGPPTGDMDSGGALTNAVTSPTAVSANPSSHYTTNSYGPTSGSRGRTYQVRVDFYNGAGVNVSSSTCTLTAETEGSL